MPGPIYNRNTQSFVMYALDRLVVSKIHGASVSIYGCLQLAIHSAGVGYQKITQGEYDNTGIARSVEVIKEGGKIAFPVFRQEFNSTEEFLNAAGHEPGLGTLTGLYRVARGIYYYFFKNN